MSGELRVPIPSAIVCDTRVMLVMSPGSPSWSSMEGSSNAYSIAMSVIAHVMCALLSESRTREGLDTERVSFSPTSVLAMSTLSIPAVEMSAYCRVGSVTFSTQTRCTRLRSSITPVISTGLVVFRLDIRVCIAVSLTVLLEVSYRASDGSRAGSMTVMAGA